MKKYDFVISLLREYNKLKAEIRDIELQLEAIRDKNEPLKAVSYDKDKISQTYRINQPTQEIACTIVDDSVLLEERKKHCMILIKRIENALTILSEKEKQLIEKRYFENKKWEDIAEELELDWTHTRTRLHRSALKKLDEFFFKKEEAVTFQ